MSSLRLIAGFRAAGGGRPLPSTLVLGLYSLLQIDLEIGANKLGIYPEIQEGETEVEKSRDTQRTNASWGSGKLLGARLVACDDPQV